MIIRGTILLIDCQGSVGSSQSNPNIDATSVPAGSFRMTHSNIKVTTAASGSNTESTWSSLRLLRNLPNEMMVNLSDCIGSGLLCLLK